MQGDRRQRLPSPVRTRVLPDVLERLAAAKARVSIVPGADTDAPAPEDGGSRLK